MVVESELKGIIATMTSRIDRAAAWAARLRARPKGSGGAGRPRIEAGPDEFVSPKAQAEYGTAKADLELGWSSVRQALDKLREHYGGSVAAWQDDIMRPLPA